MKVLNISIVIFNSIGYIIDDYQTLLLVPNILFLNVVYRMVKHMVKLLLFKIYLFLFYFNLSGHLSRFPPLERGRLHIYLNYTKQHCD